MLTRDDEGIDKSAGMARASRGSARQGKKRHEWQKPPAISSIGSAWRIKKTKKSDCGDGELAMPLSFGEDDA
uniref:Uncharacterized protein n=1 Tax=Oryza sativa subsp. japonica TaxID=39947 RepID=Q69NK9_ORYSJ|nr:hypothetical protein [Oryza sativa Japonica Group]